MKKTATLYTLFFLLLMSVCHEPMTFAQDKKDSTTSGAIQLEAITVTAQKREENPQEIPISMDVFSDFQLEDATIRNTVDLVNFSPNVFMKQTHVEHQLVIRGISSFASSIYSPAGFYVDDVSYPIHYMQNVALFDLERIEILKGPQGTLYGKNSESGVINIVTRQPGDDLEAKVSGEYASYNSFRSGASIKGPISPEKLYLGVAFQYDRSDGYAENISNDDDKVADWEHLNGRATLRWTPSEPWDIAFIADTQDYDDHCGGYRFVSGPQATDHHEVRKDTYEYTEQNGNNQILRIKRKGDAFDVLSVSSALYQALDKQNDSDLWDSPANRKENVFKIRERLYSQEIRISSVGKGPFEWLTGIYGFCEDTRFDYRHDIVSSAMTYMHPITDIDASGYAAFGQGTYTLFGKNRLTVGLRYDHETLEGEQKDNARDVTSNGKTTFDELLPKMAISHDISKDILGYVSASKGYLVGGFNYLNATQETFKYDPEYTWNYEAGVKAAMFSGRLIANVSAFYIDIEDKQVSEYDYDTLGITITNAAKAHSQGVELQLQAMPLNGFDLFAGFGYVESEFDDFIATEWNEDRSALIEKDYSGNNLPYAPRYTFNLGAQYRHPSGLFGRVDYLGTDRFYGDAANTARQDAYETLNLKLGYEQNRFDVYVWAKNVFDKKYLTYVSPYGANTIGLDGEPRIVGVTVNIRF